MVPRIAGQGKRALEAILRRRQGGARAGRQLLRDAGLQDVAEPARSSRLFNADRRYGAEGKMYYEAEGGFHFMKHDSDDPNANRTDGIVLSSNVVCRMDCGGW